MKKKLITSVVCFALLLIMFLGSSVAYFTDTQSNVNVMVAGKISIEQTEKDANGNDFVGSAYVMMPSQTMEKIVTITNDGNQPCYVRTIFAFEDSAEALETDKDGKAKEVVDYLTLTGESIVIPGVNAEGDKIQFTVNMDGKTTLFTVGYYVYTANEGKLPCVDVVETEGVKENTYTPLTSVTLQASAPNAWSEAVGEKYELFVLSQAVQTTGLETSETAFAQTFGNITGSNGAAWFKYVLERTAGYVPAGYTINVAGDVITIAPAPTNP